MSWVLKKSPVDDPQARLILLVLADCANEDGGNAFPKRETIATQSRVPFGTVGRKLADLRAAGHIEETGRTGYNNRTVVWRVVMGQAIKSERFDSNRRQSDHGRSDQSDHGRSDSRVEASVEPSEPSVLTSSDGSGRGRACEAWPQILGRINADEYTVHAWFEPMTPLDLTAGRLVLGAPRYVRSWLAERGYLTLLETAAAEVAAEVVLMPMVGEAQAA
jgi:hypothetical protein